MEVTKSTFKTFKCLKSDFRWKELLVMLPENLCGVCDFVCNQPAFSSGFAEISSIRSIGRRARLRISSGNSTRGDSFFMQSRTFSSVFIFIYLHSLQRQPSVGARIASKTGAQMNSLPGHSFCIRWTIPDSVTMMNFSAGSFLQNKIIFSVEQTASA